MPTWWRAARGRTIVAGYPWFTDWGRDTFIALRGLCLATGRLDVARSILLEWSGVVSEGMLPNRFPDGASAPEDNAVDASLWFVVAAGELIDAAGASRPGLLDAGDRARLRAAAAAIVEGHLRGTRYGIRADADGLLACGEPGVQLTWMDAKIGDWVVTPRIGKPVEVQALWLQALAGASRIERTADAASPKAAAWLDLAARGRARFAEVFWNESTGCLYDVVDVDHEPGRRRRRDPAQPDSCRRRARRAAADRDPRPVGRRRRRIDALDAARPALAGAGRARLRAALRGAAAGPRRGLPPGHGVAVVRRRVRGRLAARPR